MGVICKSFTFMLGSLCGIYVAQNYNFPNIKELAHMGLGKAKHIEETFRKPSINQRYDDDVRSE